jgi:hypothetical protein
MEEIKPAPQALSSMIQDMIVVEYDFGAKFDYDHFLSEESAVAQFKTLIESLGVFFKNLKAANESSSSITAEKNIDQRIFDVFQLKIGRRVANPILELHNLSLKAPVEVVKETVDALMAVFSSISPSLQLLNYSQLIALFELHGSSSPLLAELIQQQSSDVDGVHPVGHENNISENILNKTRSGEYLSSFNLFLDPTMSFLLQITDLIREKEEERERDGSKEEDQTEHTRITQRAQQSLEFVLLSLDRIQAARSEATLQQDPQSAVTLLTEGLLQLLEEQDEEEEEDHQNSMMIIVPTHLRVLLLSERAKYNLELSEILPALQDIDSILRLDPLNGLAYGLRSQITLATLDIMDDPMYQAMIPSPRPESEESLAQLLPPQEQSSRSALDKRDLRLFETAEDALMAFLLGGSSDLALASAAEESARETCRKFAKSVFLMKQEQLKGTNSVSESDSTTSATTAAPPRQWLLQSYLSGYQLPSEGLTLLGVVSSSAHWKSSDESTEQEEEVDVSGGIDETTEEERLAEKSLLVPPDHLLEERKGEEKGKELREKDRLAYSLLSRVVRELEASLVDEGTGQQEEEEDQKNQNKHKTNDIINNKKEKDRLHGGGKEEEDEEKVCYRIPLDRTTSTTTTRDETVEFLPFPRLINENDWHRIDCGVAERIDNVTEESSKNNNKTKTKLKIIELGGSASSSSSSSSEEKKKNNNEEENSVSPEVTEKLSSAYRRALSLLQEAAELTGVVFSSSGRIERFAPSIEALGVFSYPENLKKKKREEEQREKENQRKREKEENKGMGRGRGKDHDKKRKKNTKNKHSHNYNYDGEEEGEENPFFFSAQPGGGEGGMEDFLQQFAEKMMMGQDGDDEEEEWGEEDDDSEDEEEEYDHHHLEEEGERAHLDPNHDYDEDDSENWEDVDEEEDEDEEGERRVHSIEKHDKNDRDDKKEKDTPSSVPSVAPAPDSQSEEKEKEVDKKNDHNNKNESIHSVVPPIPPTQQQEAEEQGRVNPTPGSQNYSSSSQQRSPSYSSTSFPPPPSSREEQYSYEEINKNSEVNENNKVKEKETKEERHQDDNNNNNNKIRNDSPLPSISPFPVSRKIRARLLNLCGSLAYLAGDALRAQRCFECSLLLDQTLVDSQLKLASLLIDMDETDKAEALLTELMDSSSSSSSSSSFVSRENPLVLLHLGELEINRNEFSRANDYLKRANQVMHSSSVMEDWLCSPTSSHPSVSVEFSSDNSYRQKKREKIQEWLHCNIMALLGVSYFRLNPTRPEVSLVVLILLSSISHVFVAN